MAVAAIFSIPVYIPDSSSGEIVTGYEVQSGTTSTGSPDFITNWTDITGSPFNSNKNIIDPNGTNGTWYRARPVRTVPYSGGTVTLDTPFSKPFQPSTPLYDAIFTRALLPTLRFTYLGDSGVHQTNGTVLTETTGAGNGQWVFDGKTTRFNLQYVMNDDPVRVLDSVYKLTYTNNSTQTPTTSVLTEWQDYIVDPRAGVVEFATAPKAGDYARFEFRKTDFVNDDLLVALTSAVNSLSHFGLNGYQINTNYNLQSINTPFKWPDVQDIVCMVAMLLMRDGETEAALRSNAAWRDGNSSVDPQPSRALEFAVTKLQVSETSVRQRVNSLIRGNVLAKGRGEFDIFWDMTQMTPLTSGMFRSMPGGSYGTLGSGMGVPMFPWYI